jgi:hypothetical protein
MQQGILIIDDIHHGVHRRFQANLDLLLALCVSSVRKATTYGFEVDLGARVS